MGHRQGKRVLIMMPNKPNAKAKPARGEQPAA
jgi:hypothetical protein